MRLFRRAIIALSIALCAGGAHAQRNVSRFLRVNAYDDRIEARRLEAARVEQRRLDEHREEAHREDERLEQQRLEQQRLAEARREARIEAYNAWLQRWHETRTIEPTTP